MSPVKTAYVPRFGSSQRDDEPQPSPSQTVDRVESASRCRKKEKRANKRARGENLQSPLKVKLPQFSAHKLSKKKATKGDGKTPGGRVLEPAASRPKPRTPVAPVAGAGDSQGAGTDIDAFFLSQTPTSKAADQKKKVKLTVLRTIAKMLEENHFIRQRLIALSQAQ